MLLLKFVINVAAVVAGVLSALCWMRAASAKVLAPDQANEGVGYGGSPVNVRDDKGVILDLLQTYRLQSRWNSRAASAAAAAAILSAILLLVPSE